MPKLYHKLAKKATWCLIFSLFTPFLSLPVLAREPNDPGFIEQQQMWSQIGAPTAWEFDVGSRAPIVAVVDTGVDAWHNDLKDNIWTNGYEIANNGLDDDNNGYVDDINGWNFVDENNDPRTSVFNASDSQDAVDHGTVIAGLIGATGNNDSSGTGLNWRVRIMPLRTMDSSGFGNQDNIVKAVNYAVDNGASVIVMSLFGPYSDENVKLSLKRAWEKGVITVVSAGNREEGELGNLDIQKMYPACYDDGDENFVLTVASVDKTDRLSNFSMYGSCVDLTAPGENIFSTERYAPAYGYNEEFRGGWNGTSFSAPLVAGSVALLKSLRPDWTAEEIQKVVLETADDISATNPGKNGKIGRGRLNIGNAMIKASGVNRSSGVEGKKYYLRNGDVWQTDLFSHQEKFFISREGMRVLSVDAIRYDKNADYLVGVLSELGGNYFFKFYREDGKFLKESQLKSGANGFKIKKIRFLAESDGITGIMTEEINSRKNSSIFVRRGLDGVISVKATLPVIVESWTVDSSSGRLFWARSNKNNLNLGEINFSNKKSSTWSVAGKYTISDSIYFDINSQQSVLAFALFSGKKSKVLVYPEGNRSGFFWLDTGSNKAETVTAVEKSGGSFGLALISGKKASVWGVLPGTQDWSTDYSFALK